MIGQRQTIEHIHKVVGNERTTNKEQKIIENKQIEKVFIKHKKRNSIDIHMYLHF